jgi:hypothetical protein
LRDFAQALVSLFAPVPCSHTKPITPPFAVGRGKPGGGREQTGTTLGNGAAQGKVIGPAKQKNKVSMTTNISARLKSSRIWGHSSDPDAAIGPRDLPCSRSLKGGMGEDTGVDGGALGSVHTMPGPIEISAGPTLQDD